MHEWDESRLRENAGSVTFPKARQTRCSLCSFVSVLTSRIAGYVIRMPGGVGGVLNDGRPDRRLLVKRLCRSSLWIVPILILIGLAVLHHEDKQNNSPDKRNQHDKKPPSTSPGIVKSADRYSNSRDYN